MFIRRYVYNIYQYKYSIVMSFKLHWEPAEIDKYIKGNILNVCLRFSVMYAYNPINV